MILQIKSLEKSSSKITRDQAQVFGIAFAPQLLMVSVGTLKLGILLSLFPLLAPAAYVHDQRTEVVDSVRQQLPDFDFNAEILEAAQKLGKTEHLDGIESLYRKLQEILASSKVYYVQIALLARAHSMKKLESYYRREKATKITRDYLDDILDEELLTMRIALGSLVSDLALDKRFLEQKKGTHWVRIRWPLYLKVHNGSKERIKQLESEIGEAEAADQMMKNYIGKLESLKRALNGPQQ